MKAFFRNNKTFLSLFMSVIFCVGCCSITQQERIKLGARYTDNPANTNHAFRSVAGILAVDFLGNTKGINCGAFYVSPDTLLTARHCFVEPDEYKKLTDAIRNVTNPSITDEQINKMLMERIKGSEINLLDYDTMDEKTSVKLKEPKIKKASIVYLELDTFDKEERDVAVLKLKDGQERSKDWEMISKTCPEIASRIYSIGMPMGLPWVLSQGIVAQRFLFPEAPNDAVMMLGNISIYGGSSGGMVINDYGEVVGMMVMSFEPTQDTYGSTIALFICGGSLLDVLKKGDPSFKLRIFPDKESVSPKKSPKNNIIKPRNGV